MGEIILNNRSVKSRKFATPLIFNNIETNVS